MMEPVSRLIAGVTMAIIGAGLCLVAVLVAVSLSIRDEVVACEVWRMRVVWVGAIAVALVGAAVFVFGMGRILNLW